MAKQQQDKYIVRFPDGLRERIKEVAEVNGRSMNAEIIEALEKAYPPIPEEMSELYYKVREYMLADDKEDKARLASEVFDLREKAGLDPSEFPREGNHSKK